MCFGKGVFWCVASDNAPKLLLSIRQTVIQLCQDNGSSHGTYKHGRQQ
ncbi:MAG: hypothetical protein R3C56_15130 [Pirellulaceae bacterium]